MVIYFEYMSVDISYYSFSPSRADQEWGRLEETISLLQDKHAKWKQEKNEGYFYRTLTPSENAIYENWECFQSELQSDKQGFEIGLKRVDLGLGSVVAEYLEDGKVEFIMLDALIQAAGLEIEEEDRSNMGCGGHTPTKQAWIKLFSSIDKDLLTIASDFLHKELNWDVEQECIPGLVRYLQYIRPVIKDLKEVDDALFVSVVNGEGFGPDKVGTLLTTRVEQHMQQVQGLELPDL